MLIFFFAKNLYEFNPINHHFCIDFIEDVENKLKNKEKRKIFNVSNIFKENHSFIRQYKIYPFHKIYFYISNILLD